MPTSDQYTELAELAGGFIHEVKNHISTLGLNLQLLAEDFENPQNPRERRAYERVLKLQNECQRLVDVSNDFLRFARAKQLHRQMLRLDDVVAEVVDFFSPTARASNVMITWYPCGGAARVLVDPDVFKQALLNLLINSVQAMPNGGEIILQDRLEEQYVRLDVIDSGCGIPPETLDSIFKPFHTSKPGGTGLGLPHAKSVIEAHGGWIEAESQVGRGTKFSIRLPVANAVPLPEPAIPLP